MRSGERTPERKRLGIPRWEMIQRGVWKLSDSEGPLGFVVELDRAWFARPSYVVGGYVPTPQRSASKAAGALVGAIRKIGKWQN